MKEEKVKKKDGHNVTSSLCLAIIAIFCLASNSVYAQQKGHKKTGRLTASRYSSLPSGYNQVGTTQLYYKQSSNSIDMIGYYNGYYYSSTYGDRGYALAIKVGNNSAVRIDCLNGTTTNGVTVRPSVEQQGELARICYTVTNNDSTDVIISMGTHADVMIGSNDQAPISRRIDTVGQTYGLTMKDGNGAQLCVLFGSGLAGVTAVSDFWFGFYSTNSESYQMVGEYYGKSNYMQENGSYDSGMGWCWKNKTVPAGSTVVFSYLVGVGEVNLEPNSSFEATPDDPEGWNDLSRPHKLALEGTYESPAGLDGMIEYAVEDSEEWHQLTETIPSGSTFNDSLVAMFDASREKHVIRFRTRDNVGNTTLLPSIEYIDVSFLQYTGITDKTYTGDSIYQEVECTDVAKSQITTGRYSNNINAGTASFCIEGVFPYTIGRKSYTFQINPAPLSGDINLTTDSCVYNGQQHYPEWTFTNESYTSLEEGKDYNVTYNDNRYPGTAKLIVKGKGNYTSELTKTFFIDKAPLRDELFSITLPDEDISYDGNEHQASATASNGVGEITFMYIPRGESTTLTEGPVEEGSYDVYTQISNGELYYGRPTTMVGSFTIYRFDEDEWQSLSLLYAEIQQMGVTLPWDIAGGAKNVSKFEELTVREGHVVGISLANKKMSGIFPSSITAFPRLEDIDLSGNSLSGDIGTSAYAFAQQNPGMMTSVRKVNLSGNKLSGNIATFANSLPNLTTLDASGNCIEDVIPAISSSVTSLDLSRQTIARVTPLALTGMSANSLAESLPTVLLYDHENQTYTTDIAMLCTTADSTWSMTLTSQDGELSITCTSEQNTYFGESGEVLRASLLNGDGSQEGSTFSIALTYEEGDGNFDGQINVLDLQAMLNYMFEEYVGKPFNFTASNLWKDDIINVQDAVCMVNILLDKTRMPVSAHDPNHVKRNSALTYDADASVYVSDGNLIVYSDKPLSAFDIVVKTTQTCKVTETLNDLGFTCSVRQEGDQAHLVGYSLSGAVLPAGQNILCSLASGIVTYVMLADSDANEIKSSVTEPTTDIMTTTSDNHPSNEVYRYSIGAKRSIVIDANGKKYLHNEDK